MVTHALVIFDCDGILVDSERLTVAVKARLLTELGWPHTPEQVARRFLGRSTVAILADVERYLGAEAMREFDQRSSAEIDAAFDAALAPVAGVKGVIDWLIRNGVAMCVASSGSHAKLRKTLGITGLGDFFVDKIFSAGDVRHGKPAPDLFLHAAARMGFAPEHCAVIEDSLFGVQAAVASNTTVFGFDGGLTDTAVLAEAGAVVFDDMSQLPDLLRQSVL